MNVIVRHDEPGASASFGSTPPPDVAAALQGALTPRTLLRHWRLVCVVVAGFILLGGVYLVARTPVYTATTSILVSGASLSPENQRSFAMAQADLRDFSAKLEQLAAEKARLQAEADGKPELEFPDELTTASHDPAVRQIMTRASLLFESRKQAMEDESRLLSQTLQMLNDEVDSLAKQVEYSTIQQNLVEDELKGVRELADKGLASMTRQRDLERTAALLASRKVEVDTELLNRRQKIFETEQKLADVQANRRTEALAQLQQLDSETRTARARLDQARAITAAMATGSSSDPAAVENEAEVIRSDATAARVIQSAGLYLNNNFLFNNKPGIFGKMLGIPEAAAELQESEDVARGIALEVLRQNLTVERVGRGSRLDIAFASASPDLAAKVTDTYAAVYMGRDGAFADTAEFGNEQSANVAQSQILRKSTIEQSSPAPLGVLVAMLFAGLVIGPGAAIAIEFLRRLNANAR